MTVQQIINAILEEVCGTPEPIINPTCDIISCGSPNMEVTGVATTFMATVDVIRQAIDKGINFIITHEPTWFNGMDETEWCKEDSVYLAKKKLIEDNNITIWRFHDHMHFGSNVDYIYKGMIKELGWQEYLQPDEKEPWVYQIPETTLKALSDTLMKKFEMDVIQTIGSPDCKINRVGLLVGGGSLGLGREMMPMEVMERNNLNVLICGDITEWTTCAYINDAKQLGFDRSMITLGHERSEEAGMKYLAPWLKEHVNVLEDMKVEFICAKEPFVYYKNSGRNMSVYRINYSSEALCRNVDINVIVPFEAPGMPQLLDTKPKKFKTLYLLHGFGGNQNDWLDYTAIRDIAEQNNIAVVMPAGENSWYVDTGVFGAQYGTYFGKELVEYTRKAFPLSDKREDTFIGGFSMGGFGALRLGSFYHELYSKVFTFSAAFIIDNISGAKSGYKDMIADYDYYVRAFGDLDKLKNTPKDPLWCLDRAIEANDAPELYIACGKDDFLINENRKMKAEIEKRNVKLEYTETEGIHDWTFWRQQIEPAVAWCLNKNVGSA